MNLVPSKQTMGEIFKHGVTLLIMGAVISITSHYIDVVHSNALVLGLVAGRYLFTPVFNQVSKLKGV